MQAGGLKRFLSLLNTSPSPGCGDVLLSGSLAYHILPQNRWLEQEWKSKLEFWFAPCDVYYSHVNTERLMHDTAVIAGGRGTRGLEHFFTSLFVCVPLRVQA